MRTTRSSRQGGFSLVVVFLLIMVMVGVATAVMVSTQGDLNISAHDREQAVAFYAAEAAIANAEQMLVGWGNATDEQGPWTNALVNSLGGAAGGNGVGQPFRCAGDASDLNAPAPAVLPQPIAPGAQGGPVAFDPMRQAWYQWCFHNNAVDPRYRENPVTGNTRDRDAVVTIEAYGWVGPTGVRNAPGNTVVRLTQDVFFTAVPQSLSADPANLRVGDSAANPAAGIQTGRVNVR